MNALLELRPPTPWGASRSVLAVHLHAFASPFHFCRVVHSVLGLSPTAFRGLARAPRNLRRCLSWSRIPAMNPLTTPELLGVVMIGPVRFVWAISFDQRDQSHECTESRLPRPERALLKLAPLVRLAQILAAAWLFAALTASTQGQPTVTLAWDPSLDGSVAGYRLYAGLATGSYSGGCRRGKRDERHGLQPD